MDLEAQGCSPSSRIPSGTSPCGRTITASIRCSTAARMPLARRLLASSASTGARRSGRPRSFSTRRPTKRRARTRTDRGCETTAQRSRGSSRMVGKDEAYRLLADGPRAIWACERSRTRKTRRRGPTMSERIAVIGLGYVGLPVALAFAREVPGHGGLRHPREKVDELRRGYDRNHEVAEERARGRRRSR